MNTKDISRPINGPACAAILAAGIGCLSVAILACAAHSFSGVSRALNFYAPTGPLSGVSSCAIIVWCGSWIILARLWSDRTVAIRKIAVTTFILIGVSILLTFPPFMGFF